VSLRVHNIINSYSLRAGGAEKLVRTLHEGLLAGGVDARLAGLMPGEALPQAKHFGQKRAYAASAFRQLRRYLREEVQPGDIVHAHLSPCLFYCALAKRLDRGKFHLVGTEHHTSNNRRGKLHGRLIDSLTYPQMDAVACISEGAREALEAWMPVTKGRTQVIPNGVKLRFDQPPQREAGDILRILSVGRLHASKNYPNALHALTLMKDVSFTYAIAGAGDDEAALRRLASTLGLADKVAFLGQVEDLQQRFLNADVFLIPSAWEGFGMAAVEAMDAALPVVASDIPGLREVVDCQPPCALRVDPDSPPSIATALRLLNDAPLRRELGLAGHQRARAFTTERMVEHYRSFYEGVASA